MRIIEDDLQGPQIQVLLQEHLDEMHATSPAESVHALDVTGLQRPEITFWSAWIEDDLVGCVALKVLDHEHGEIKSMRTTSAARGKGVAKLLVRHVLDFSKAQGLKRLSLETGTEAFFHPARSLYRGFGFVDCSPFADYTLDPNSVFMTKRLRL
ncbi:GNAT family N-acetyltransferase [Vibrio sp. 10N.261.51.F12]|uniref:GNAT family N-acetyltransferase n=1 Tax=Vibrio sp. 10N.261.51.F12 TaxID=3229679 RepID=UPI00354EE193